LSHRVIAAYAPTIIHLVVNNATARGAASKPVTINIGTASGKTSAVEIIDLSEGQIAELVEDDEVHPGQMLGDRTPPSAAGLDLQAVDEVNHLGHRIDRCSFCDDESCRCRSADQNGIALLGDSLAMVSWYLIDRACFSLISALSR
jgi:hypothetical protein